MMDSITPRANVLTVRDTEEWKNLVAPFAFSDLEIKPQSVSKTKPSALAVPYINARSAQARLDEALGPENWEVIYTPVTLAKYEAVICRITVRIGGHVILREDGAEMTDIEAFKGGLSGAFKRTFSALGNRHLYAVEFGWRPCKVWEGNGKRSFDGWTDDALEAMEKEYNRQVGFLPSRPVAARSGTTTQRVEATDYAGWAALERAHTMDEHKDAVRYLASLGLEDPNSDQFRAFKSAAGRANWRFLAIRCRQLGIKTFEDALMMLEASGDYDPFTEDRQLGGTISRPPLSVETGGADAAVQQTPKPAEPSEPAPRVAGPGPENQDTGAEPLFGDMDGKPNADGKSAFGYTPKQMPLTAHYGKPPSIAQVRLLERIANEAGLDDLLLEAMRITLLLALGKDTGVSMGANSILIDFISNASDRAFDQCRRMAEKAMRAPQ